MEHNFKIDDATTNPVDTNVKVGDPLEIDYVMAENDTATSYYKVSSWINTPEMISYLRISELIDTSELIAKNVEKSKIQNITGPVVATSPYQVSAHPKTLRELEGLIKGLRYNLAYYIKFMEKNAVYIG
jgi:hypothetical protein